MKQYKKTILLLILLLICLSLTSCGKSKEVTKADELIMNIGEVSLESLDKILEAENAVNNLSVKQRQSLEHLKVLRKARNTYDKLKEEDTKEKIKEIESMISSINDVTLDSEKLIEQIQLLCDSLDTNEIKRISNIKDLKNAEKELQKIKDEEAKKDAIEKARSIIRVKKVWLSEFDSVGGIDVLINYTNNSEKVIKYATFGVQFYNSVGDVVTCEIKKDRINYCEDIGPYAKGEGLNNTNWRWGKFYNWNIAYVKLVSLEIEYMDGSKVNLTGEELEYVQY